MHLFLLRETSAEVKLSLPSFVRHCLSVSLRRTSATEKITTLATQTHSYV